jgi:peptidoglycan-associated lipoprotein
MMKPRLVFALMIAAASVAGCSCCPPVAEAPAPAPAPPPPADDSAARARADSIAAAQALAARQAEERARMARAQEILTSIVYFAYDSSQLDSDSEEKLRVKAAILRANPALTLRIEGHTDERGSTEYNLALGQRRAESIRTFLVGFGIAQTRLTTISYGEERPAAQGSNEQAWALNRRGEFAVTGGSITTIPPEVR